MVLLVKANNGNVKYALKRLYVNNEQDLAVAVCVFLLTVFHSFYLINFLLILETRNSDSGMCFSFYCFLHFI